MVSARSSGGLPAPMELALHEARAAAELVALTWIGRGDFTVDEWSEVVRTARQRRTNPTADYLLGTPMLGDYLEEGLTQLGLTVEDLEPART